MLIIHLRKFCRPACYPKKLNMCMFVKLGSSPCERSSGLVFENKVLRKIFGAKRDQIIGEWRKLHNAELHALYSSLREAI